MLRLIIFTLAGMLCTGATHAQALAQTIKLSDCRIAAGPGAPSLRARCGTLSRPLDPDDPAAGNIEIRVAVVPALNLTPEADPLVPIAGGPGQGTIRFYAAYSRAFEDVRRTRDILLVDQRGTGESARMDCPVDDGLVEGQYSTALTIEQTDACLEQLPYDPRFFTTSIAVTDLEAVRKALGYPSLNLYGVSYGTRVAQHFARRYPESTRTVVLDGVVPPQLPLGPEIATESQRALDNGLARCARDASCNDRFPGIKEVFSQVLAELTAAPVAVTIPNPNSGRPEDLLFGRNELAVAVRLLAYNPKTMALLPLLISEAGGGNFVPLASQYRMTMIALTDVLALGMHNAVMCTEDIPFLEEAWIDYDGIAASYMGAMQLEALEAICSVWPAGRIDAGLRSPLSTDIPVLLLSGDADPITPPRHAELAAVDLDNSLHLIGKDQGHGQISVGCTSRIVADFINAADPESVGAGCLERSFVMPFFVDFSGPSP